MPCRPDFVAFLSHERQERKKEREKNDETSEREISDGEFFLGRNTDDARTADAPDSDFLPIR
jgi:hypothetical protein